MVKQTQYMTHRSACQCSVAVSALQNGNDFPARVFVGKGDNITGVLGEERCLQSLGPVSTHKPSTHRHPTIMPLHGLVLVLAGVKAGTVVQSAMKPGLAARPALT